MERKRPHPVPPGLGGALATAGLLVLARILLMGASTLTLLALLCWAVALLATIDRFGQP